jgi:predicted RNA-binding Zn ribbon-like protein
MLLAIAEELARFLCGESLMNVKACEDPGCRLMFADCTRKGTRRWCSKDLCGSRGMKVTHQSASEQSDYDSRA